MEKRSGTLSEMQSHGNIDYGSIECLVDTSNIRNNNSLIYTERRHNKSATIYSWAEISFGIGSSFTENDLLTVHSLTDVPSNDRRTNAFLMSASLQSMILGTTMLSLPFCIKVAGIWSVVLTVVIGIFTNFTANILADCQYQVSFKDPGFQKRIYTSFVDMSKACWNSFGRYIMEMMVYLSLARNVVVIILLTDVSRDILLHFGLSGYDVNYLAVGWTLVSIPFLFITKVSILAWTSFIGLILYLLALLAMFIAFCFSANIWHLNNISTSFDVKGVGIATGIIINSYAVHMNLPSLEASMQNPSTYKRTTNVTFFVNIISKIAFSCFGYMTYLETTEQEVTSNVHLFIPLPIFIRVAVMFFAFSTIPLQSFVVFELIDETFQSHFVIFKNKKFYWLFLSRAFCMLLCLLLAVLVPHFGIAVSLIGSLRGSMIALILPAGYYIHLQTNDVRLDKKVMCYVIIIFGILFSILGLYSSFEALIYGI